MGGHHPVSGCKHIPFYCQINEVTNNSLELKTKSFISFFFYKYCYANLLNSTDETTCLKNQFAVTDPTPLAAYPGYDTLHPYAILVLFLACCFLAAGERKPSSTGYISTEFALHSIAWLSCFSSVGRGRTTVEQPNLP